MADSDWEDVTAQHVPSAGQDDWEDVTYGPPAAASPEARTKQDMYRDAMKRVDNTDYAGAANNAVSMMAGGGLAKAAGEKAFGLLGNSVEGAITGAAQAGPDHRLRGLLMGAAMPSAVKAGGAALGAGSRALIQKAMNINEPTRELGQRLLDSGIWGTGASMGKQVDSAIGKEGQGLTDAVGKIDGAIEVAPLAQTMDDYGGKLAIGGEVPPALQGKADKFANEANYLGTQGAMTPQDLLKYKQVQGNNAYSMRGNPLTSAEAEVSGAASREAGDVLKAKYGEQFPGQPNAIANQNDKLSALFKAQRGLSKKPTLVDYLKGAGVTAAAKLAGGAPLAAATLLAKSSIGQSGAARALNLGQKGLEKVDPAILRSILLSNGGKPPTDGDR